MRSRRTRTVVAAPRCARARRLHARRLRHYVSSEADPQAEAVLGNRHDLRPDGNQCEYPFTVAEIPAGMKFYSVHIGSTNRGEQTYTAAQLESGVALTLG